MNLPVPLWKSETGLINLDLSGRIYKTKGGYMVEGDIFISYEELRFYQTLKYLFWSNTGLLTS
jgi:hypothetical protein